MQVALARAELAAGAVAEQHRRPDHRVEDDVVLPHEVVVARVRVLPPLAPRLGRAAVLRPLDARRQVADDGVEPDVDPLRVLRVAVDRNRDAPVDVARHRARLQLAHEPEREVLDVRPPALLRGEPRLELLGERRQVEEEVRRLAELRRRAVDDRPRVDQVDRVELVAAVVALVAARLREAADRAGPLDVAVGQRAAGLGGERAERRLLDEIALVVERLEDVLRDAVVVARRRAREAVVRDAEIAQVDADELVVAVGELTRRDAAPVGGDHHRRAVLVRPAHHQDVVALQPVVAREHVRRHGEAGHVADVARPTRVGPGRRDEDLLRFVRQCSLPGRSETGH